MVMAGGRRCTLKALNLTICGTGGVVLAIITVPNAENCYVVAALLGLYDIDATTLPEFADQPSQVRAAMQFVYAQVRPYKRPFKDEIIRHAPRAYILMRSTGLCRRVRGGH